jgi:cytochrome bd-type quinol oxidase subunit 2
VQLSRGPGRTLTAVYAVFAVAATARAAVQLATHYSEAPVAYLLSAFAGVVYVLATLALWRDLRPLAWLAIGVELTGVLVVGTLSYADRSAFPDQTVWSGYGSGYGYVPLVLPVLGLLWLRRSGEPG